MPRLFFAACLAAMLPSAFAGDATFQNDFEKAEVGKNASDLEFLVIGDGEFKVVQDEKNKVLELSPIPLETYGCLFGPVESENVEAQLRAFGTLTGRRFPVFGVGLSGVGGYILRVNPAKKAVELLKGEEVKASTPYTWKTATWTHIRLSVKKVKDGQWTISGKAWEQGQEEPKDWQVNFDDAEKPLSGRGSLWGIPYSGTHMRFDDLLIKKL
jgi:hypothetical protein